MGQERIFQNEHVKNHIGIGLPACCSLHNGNELVGLCAKSHREEKVVILYYFGWGDSRVCGVMFAANPRFMEIFMDPFIS